MRNRLFKITVSIIALMLLLTGCDSLNYKKAVSLYEDGSYSEACEIFIQLGDYKISKDYVSKCKYELAMDAYEAREYENALAVFIELGNFRDCEDYAIKCKYNIGLKCMDIEDYHQARTYFLELNGYQDSEEYLRKASGLILQQYFQKNDEQPYVRYEGAEDSVAMGWSEEDAALHLSYAINGGDPGVYAKILSVRLFFEPGDTEATVECSYYYNTNSSPIIVIYETAEVELDFEKYQYGDEFDLKNHKYKCIYNGQDYSGIMNKSTYGVFERELDDYLTVMLRAMDSLLRDYNIGITPADLGFTSLR